MSPIVETPHKLSGKTSQKSMQGLNENEYLFFGNLKFCSSV
jgi:hypothetical protein